MEQRDSMDRSSGEVPPNASSFALNEKANTLNGPPLDGSPTDVTSGPVTSQHASDISSVVDNVLRSDVSLSFESSSSTLLINR